MRTGPEDHEGFEHRLQDHLLRDSREWSRSLEELNEHNMRLARIVSELLIKNQHLRFTLEQLSRTSGMFWA